MSATANLKNEKFFLRLIRTGKLKVTKSGRAFNLISGNEIAKTTASGGYRKISWQDPKSKKIRQIQLHRLVWSYFNGVPDDPYLQINHLDGVKFNCRLSNLELTDSSGNAIHAVDTGLRVDPRGEERPNAKFSDSQVKRLRKYFATYCVSADDIADEINAHPVTVYYMLKGITYSHVNSGYEAACRAVLNDNRGLVSNKTIKTVRELRRKGLSSYAIAKATGLARNTVMKYW